MEDDFIRGIGDMTISPAETSDSTIETSDDGNETFYRNNNSIKITYQITHDYTKLPKETPSINVLYANTRSINTEGKIDELKCMLKMIPKTVHLILITETWLDEVDKKDTSLELENYILILGNRIGKKQGGGVAAYIRADMRHSYTEVTYRNGNNYLWVYFDEPRLNIGVVYYPGNTGEKEFLEDFKFQLKKQKGQRAIVLGDFNINVLEPSKSKNYEKILEETDFSLLNNKSEKYFTRKAIKNDKDNKDNISAIISVIDHVSSNLKAGDYHLALIDSSLSDHRQVYFEIRNPELLPKKQEDEALNSNLSKILSEAINRNEDENQLEKDMVQIVYKYSKDVKQDDWITDKICEGITVRNLCYQNYQKDPNEKTKMLFEKAKEAVNEEMGVKKSEHKILTLIKNGCNAKKIPSRINIDSKFITDSEKICEQFNNYFSITTGMGQKLPEEPNMFSDVVTNSKQNNQLNQLSKMPTCTLKEINEIIVSLDRYANVGICGIDVASMKGFKKKKEVCRDLSTCINNCFDTGYFPDCLKVSKVIPVHGTGLKSILNNYTFELVLPVFSMILEKLLYRRLNMFSSPVCFETKDQSLLPMIAIVDDINMSIQKKEIAVGLFIDLKEASNKVNHSLLLKKLQSLGINGMALKIIESYFANQKHIVTIKDFNSNLRDIKQGVPQGSILGGLLFDLYKNGVTTLNLNGSIIVSVGKLSLFYYGVKVEDLFEKAKQDLDFLSKWFRENCLVINSEKICYVTFTSEKEETNNYEFKYNNIKIEKAEQAEVLGLVLDSRLTWTPHIQKINQILKTFLENLKSVSCCPKYAGVEFYNACVRPLTDYMIEIWGNGSEAVTLESLLVKLQSKLNAHEEGKKHCVVLSLKQTIFYKECILAYKTLSAEITSRDDGDLFIHLLFDEDCHAGIVLPADELATEHGNQSISGARAASYSKLPEGVRNAGSIAEFKRKLRSHLKTSSTFANNAKVYECTSPKCMGRGTKERFTTSSEKKKHREAVHKGTTKGKQLFREVKPELRQDLG